MSERQQKWLYVIPFALALGALLPFLDKAFTIDDTLFLLQAQQALKDPLHPTAFDVVWDKNVWMRCSAIMPSGPVQAFLLIPSLLLGGAEWAAHAVQLAVLCLGLIGTIRLSRALGGSVFQAAFAASIVAVSPCVIGMAGTVMPDVPAMAFGVLGLDAALRWKRDRRIIAALACIFHCALAALARPHAGAFVGVAFLMLAEHKEEKGLRGIEWHWSVIWPVLIAAALVPAYNVISKDPFPQGGSLVSATKSLAGWVQPERHFIANLSHWALTTPIVVLFVLIQKRKLDWHLVAITTLPLGALAVGIGYEKQAWIGLAAAMALATLIGLFRNPAQFPLPVQLALAACLLMPLPLVIYVHLPPKYLVSSVPAAAIIVARLAIERPRRTLPLLAATLGTYFVICIQLLRADAAFSNLGRRAAAELVRPLLQSGERVWFTGHWGFQWYAMKEGATPLTLRDSPSPRDYVVGPSGNYDGGPVIDNFQNRYLVRKLENTEYHLFTMKSARGAGFYSNWWGLLPCASGWDELEVFSVWQFTFASKDP